MAQISVMSGARTLTKQARVSDTESCQAFLDKSLPVKPRSPVKPATGVAVGPLNALKMGNGHLEQILMLDDRTIGASSEEISTASTEIVSVRPTHRNPNQNKRDLRIRSLSADRILEEDIKFTRVAIDIEDDYHEHSTKNCGGAKTYSKKIIRQISDKSYLSWQESEASCQDSNSIRQDSLSIRQDSLSTRQDSLSIRQSSLTNRQDSFSTRQESVPSGPDSSASRGPSPSCPSPMFNSSQRLTCVTREPARRLWGHRRSYTAYGGYGQYSWAGSSHQSMESVERLSQSRLNAREYRHLLDRAMLQALHVPVPTLVRHSRQTA